MALVLVLAGVIPGLAAAGLALGAGAGFLFILGAYMLGGLLGMLGMAGFFMLRGSKESFAEAALSPHVGAKDAAFSLNSPLS